MARDSALWMNALGGVRMAVMVRSTSGWGMVRVCEGEWERAA